MGSVNTNEDLIKLVNSSGFLFQLRVESEVRATSDLHGWTVITREQPWFDVETRKEGFIDLILGLGRMRMIVECKRTTNADWVFLLPGHGSVGTQMRSVWAYRTVEQPASWGVRDCYPNPESPIAEFCVVRGKGEGDSPMLERICRVLLDSVERTAVEEISLLPPNNSTVGPPIDFRIYLPLIVTNAQLHACYFDINNVSLDEGKLLEQGQFQTVPFIRFRKSLATRLTSGATPNTLEQANRDMTRTVLVVNSSSFVSFLTKWDLQLSPPTLGI